jgi:plasmid stability protein
VPQLIVRNIDKAVVDSLRARASRHGRSAEEEHREILQKVLLPRPGHDLKQHLLAMPGFGNDRDFQIVRTGARLHDPFKG